MHAIHSEATSGDLPEQRRDHILARLRQDGKVVAAELCASFGVSEDTIRRDLRALDDAGLLKRVHGGALPVSSTPTYNERQTQFQTEKRAIARTAATLVKDGQVIIFGAGTTNLEVAHHLPPHLRATAIAVSPQTALALSSYPNIDVILIGGRLDKRDLVVTDSAAVEQLRQFHADLCFLGICSLHPEAGFTANNYEEVMIDRVMIAQSSDVIAVTLAQKLGTIAAYAVGPLSDITYIVTEAATTEQALKPYRSLGIDIIRAAE